jgi:hypothetical protein
VKRVASHKPYHSPTVYATLYTLYENIDPKRNIFCLY